MYCYDFPSYYPARPFLNVIWTQGKKLKLWEVYDFERGQDGTVGIVIGYDLEELGLDSWKRKEFLCLPKGRYRPRAPHSLLLGSYLGSSPG
jgi:hypothetical protein